MNTINNIITISLALVLSACSGYTSVDQGPQGITGPVGPPGLTLPSPIPVIDDVTMQINALVADENTYRLGLGQTQLSPGLSCQVQKVASGYWLSSSSSGYNSSQGVVVMTGTNYTYLYNGAFNQPTNVIGVSNLIPIQIQPIFTNANYRIVCQGQLVVLTTGYYSFSLNSDDGSILNVNGTTVVSNDGPHGMQQVNGSIYLREGVRSFSVQYGQLAGGYNGMILLMNGSSINPNLYQH